MVETNLPIAEADWDIATWAHWNQNFLYTTTVSIIAAMMLMVVLFMKLMSRRSASSSSSSQSSLGPQQLELTPRIFKGASVSNAFQSTVELTNFVENGKEHNAEEETNTLPKSTQQGYSNDRLGTLLLVLVGISLLFPFVSITFISRSILYCTYQACSLDEFNGSIISFIIMWHVYTAYAAFLYILKDGFRNHFRRQQPLKSAQYVELTLHTELFTIEDTKLENIEWFARKVYELFSSCTSARRTFEVSKHCVEVLQDPASKVRYFTC